MPHIFFISYLLAFSLGLASLFVVLALYLQYRRKEILYYFFLLFSWMFFFMIKLMHIYLIVFLKGQIQDLTSTLVWLFFFYGLLFIIAYPLLIHSLLDVPLKGLRKIIFITIDSIFAIILVLLVVFFSSDLLKLIPYFIITVTLITIYGIVLFLIHRKELGSHFFKKSIEIFFLIQFFLIFTGFFTNHIDTQNQFFSSRMYDVLFLFGFFLFHLFNLYFSFRYFNTPSYLENGKLTEYFLKTFGLSEREGEIIALIAQGTSNNETAKRLFISPKTVETHLYNVFQKTGVKNRTQLINLLYSKKQS